MATDPDTALKEQAILNRSFNSVTGKLKVEQDSLPLPSGAATSANQTNGTQQTKIKETAPNDSTKSNPSLVLTRNGSGYITSIAQTIGSTTYTQTITRDTNNYITNISAWV